MSTQNERELFEAWRYEYGEIFTSFISWQAARAPLLSRIEWLEAEKHSWKTYAKGLYSRIDALSKDAEWQPIETAPRDCAFLGYQRVNDDIWCIAPMYLTGVDYLFLQFHSDNSEHVANPTHWKPIPKPPAIDAAISEREGE